MRPKHFDPFTTGRKLWSLPLRLQPRGTLEVPIISAAVGGFNRDVARENKRVQVHDWLQPVGHEDDDQEKFLLKRNLLVSLKMLALHSGTAHA